ncbi:MAG: hypothetical protein CMC97_06190 [Flavobacteriales bacterium]|nr:hypothetical protein [Flavobacteriales bacterium]
METALALLGPPWRIYWALLEASWSLLGVSWALLRCLGAILGGLGGVFADFLILLVVSMLSIVF